MAQLVIDNFKQGMDTRQERVSGKAGALWLAKNVHINRGGDIERRKKFVPAYTLPAGASFGLLSKLNELFVFGGGLIPAGSPDAGLAAGQIVPGVNYRQQLWPGVGTAPAMTSILTATLFGTDAYVIAEFADGSIYHYFAQTRVTDWDILSSSGTFQQGGLANYGNVAQALATKINGNSGVTAAAVGQVVTITAAVPGVPYTISTNVINSSGGNGTLVAAQTQANITGHAEVKATGTVTITGGTHSAGVNTVSAILVNGVDVLGSAVDWNTSNSATASAVAAQITTHSSPTYTAAVSTGSTVVITAQAGTGATPNGYVIAPTIAGNTTTTTSGAMAGGITAVSSQAEINTATLGGTYAKVNRFIITINGTDYSVTGEAANVGTFAYKYGEKMYSTGDFELWFSAINSPGNWYFPPQDYDINGNILPGLPAGSGNIDMSIQNGPVEFLTGGAEFNGEMAVFSRRAIRLWDMDANPTLNKFNRTISNTGTIAPKSICPYGGLDLFYLDTVGIRSLQLRAITGQPMAADIGVAIDSNVRDFLKTLDDNQIATACSCIDPVDGRYLLALQNQIFVFSYFPGSKVSAWTVYDLTDEIGATGVITDMVVINQQLYIRAGDTIYLYGGTNGTTYPNAGEIIGTVQLPFLSGNTPGTMKDYLGYDMGGSGQWDVSMCVNPGNEKEVVQIGRFTQSTYGNTDNTVQHPAAMVALNLVCNQAGPATISNMVILYNGGEEQK